MKKREIILIIVLATLLLVSRAIMLDLRPLHHDEGVNYFFADNLLEKGIYKYDPINYHGPVYFFMIYISFLFLGISKFSLRFPAVFFGILLGILPLFLKRKEKYLMSLFIIISPSIMYYSRYSIHEIVFVFFTLLSMIFISLIIEKKSLAYLPYFAVSIAFLLTTKETAIIVLAILALIILMYSKRLKEIKFKENHAIIAFSILIFIVIYILFFTSFYTNPTGIYDSFKGFLPWTERGITEPGHAKPFYFWLAILFEYELPLLVLSAIGIFFALQKKNKKDIFLGIASTWLFLSFVIYSIIPYKTLWLIINLTVPMCLLSALALFKIKEKNNLTALLILLSSIVILSYSAVYVNFMHPWQPDNKFAYVHTDKDIENMSKKIDVLWKDSSQTILIVSKGAEYWPLPFYLHGKSTYYIQKNEIDSSFFLNYNETSMFIVPKALVKNTNDIPKEFQFEIYSIRPEEEFLLIYKK